MAVASRRYIPIQPKHFYEMDVSRLDLTLKRLQERVKEQELTLERVSLQIFVFEGFSLKQL